MQGMFLSCLVERSVAYYQREQDGQPQRRYRVMYLILLDNIVSMLFQLSILHVIVPYMLPANLQWPEAHVKSCIWAVAVAHRRNFQRGLLSIDDSHGPLTFVRSFSGIWIRRGDGTNKTAHIMPSVLSIILSNFK